MISLYTTAFNIDKLDVDFDEVFSNWLYYADEIVIATLRCQHEEVRDKVIKSKFYNPKKIGVVSRHLEIQTDLYWDGKLKDAALKNCRHDIALQIDLDERISGNKNTLTGLAQEILKQQFSCSVMIPTIDLYEDLDHMINIGYKWYLHTRQGTSRGSVHWAKKEDGSFDPEKSDTCELIDENGNLIPCIGKVPLGDEDDPKIIHLGYLNLEKRNKLNKEFWAEIWDFRKTGIRKNDFQATDIKSGDPRKQLHNLPQPLWPKL